MDRRYKKVVGLYEPDYFRTKGSPIGEMLKPDADDYQFKFDLGPEPCDVLEKRRGRNGT